LFGRIYLFQTTVLHLIAFFLIKVHAFCAFPYFLFGWGFRRTNTAEVVWQFSSFITGRPQVPLHALFQARVRHLSRATDVRFQSEYHPRMKETYVLGGI
jgi:hypothetical protein